AADGRHAIAAECAGHRQAGPGRLRERARLEHAALCPRRGREGQADRRGEQPAADEGHRTGAPAPFATGAAPKVACAPSSSCRRKARSSWMVLISGAGKTIVEFFSTEISINVCRLRSCSASGWAIMM